MSSRPDHRLSERIRARQYGGAWETFTREPPAEYPCPTCGTLTPQDLVEVPDGQAWKCRRCNALMSKAGYPFDPRQPPDGREEMELAIRVLVQHVMALRPVHPASIYEVVRPYFEAGWCVRDVLYAMNRDPDDELYPTGSSTWTLGEPPDKTLWRLKKRLRTWRWRDEDDGRDIMPGGWTTMKYAMEDAAVAQKEAQRRAEIEYRERLDAANRAEGFGRDLARQVVISAAARARLDRAGADAREAYERSQQARGS